MKNQKTNKFIIVKLIFFIISIILIALLSIKLFPLFVNLGTPSGQIAFKEYISNSSFSGILMLLGLQLLQILVPILPGEPIEFLAGMCYGTLGGLLITSIGSFLSSFVIFYCVKKLGKNFIYAFFEEDIINKIENSKLFSNPEKIELFLFITFLIPGTPKDLITYFAGLFPIHPMRFLLISTLCRFPSIISSTFAGSNLVAGNWKLVIIIYIITFIISGIFLIIYNKKHRIK